MNQGLTANTHTCTLQESTWQESHTHTPDLWFFSQPSANAMCHDGVGNLVKSWPTQLTNTYSSLSLYHDNIVRQTLYFEHVVQSHDEKICRLSILIYFLFDSQIVWINLLYRNLSPRLIYNTGWNSFLSFELELPFLTQKPWSRFHWSFYRQILCHLFWSEFPKAMDFVSNLRGLLVNSNRPLCWQLGMSILLNTSTASDRKGLLSVCLLALPIRCGQIVLLQGTSQLLQGFALKWNPGKIGSKEIWNLIIADLGSAEKYNMKPLLLLLPWCLFKVECCNVYADYCDLAELHLQVVCLQFIHTGISELYNFLQFDTESEFLMIIPSLAATTFPSLSHCCQGSHI